MAGPGDDEREWVLEGPPDRVERVLLGGLLVVVWAPVEAALARWVIVVPDEVSDLPLVSLLLALLAGWTYPGYLGVRELTNGNRGHVITADRHGVRSERITWRGRRRRMASVAWPDIRTANAGPGHLRGEGTYGSTFLSYASDGMNYAIAEYITTRVTEPEGRRRLPVVQGFKAYLDDRGPTITTLRDRRLREARWGGGIAAVLWADAAAAATDFDSLWGLVGVLGAVAAGFTAGAVRLVRATPRWTAVPGAVVRIDRPGGEVTFRATALKLTRSPGDGGDPVSTNLTAIDGTSETSLAYGPANDDDSLAAVARWLADAAEIPFADKRPLKVAPAGVDVETTDASPDEGRPT